MGHDLAPAIMQHFSQVVAHHLHQLHNVAMVAYLNDWLIFGSVIPTHDIQRTLHYLDITINEPKSNLQPTTALMNLSLHIDVICCMLRPTSTCLTHMWDLLTSVPQDFNPGPATQCCIRHMVGSTAPDSSIQMPHIYPQWCWTWATTMAHHTIL
jgi:hypothetical protein